jgi:hypothetical protein
LRGRSQISKLRGKLRNTMPLKLNVVFTFLLSQILKIATILSSNS